MEPAPATTRPRRQPMAELKLRRLVEHNQRLREDLARPRVRVSEASVSLVKYCGEHKDPLIPSLWGELKDDPYDVKAEGGCCIVM